MLSRAVRIFEAFGPETKSLTASEIARRTDLPVPTAHRLIGQMLNLGLLQRDANHRIQVGVRMWELASRSQQVLSLREAAKPYLNAVQSLVKHHTQLGVLEGRDVLFIELISNQRAVVNITKVASRLPIHTCSSGLVLLANASAQLQEEVLSSLLEPFTDRTLVDPAQLRRCLAETRRQGFAVSRGTVDPTAAGVAVPIRDKRHGVIGTVSVIVPNDHEHTSFALPVLLAATRGIAREIRAQNRDEADGWISR
ncbi:MAG: putative HTH-type transcriptional regulator yagI [Homoserinimonas sp.]|nr:putative HTH-type transcriptional regulator yagI [Homoserinimonas sp.]